MATLGSNPSCCRMSSAILLSVDTARTLENSSQSIYARFDTHLAPIQTSPKPTTTNETQQSRSHHLPNPVIYRTKVAAPKRKKPLEPQERKKKALHYKFWEEEMSRDR